ncbi:hypothetical protein CE658_26970 [Salmonella enterica]|nr:hypothetical protein [Salmonella enterica]
MVRYSTASNLGGTHATGDVAQYAEITAPVGTAKVLLSGVEVSSNNEHAAISLINDVTNTGHHTADLYASAAEADTIYVGLVAKDADAWPSGVTTGVATITFYAS